MIGLPEAKQSNFIEMQLRHGCYAITLLHVFETPFSKSTTGWLPLYMEKLENLDWFMESFHESSSHVS